MVIESDDRFVNALTNECYVCIGGWQFDLFVIDPVFYMQRDACEWKNTHGIDGILYRTVFTASIFGHGELILKLLCIARLGK
jgi:hypothetical protein